MKSTGAWSSDELQRLDIKLGHQDSSPHIGCQGDTPYWPWWVHIFGIFSYLVSVWIWCQFNITNVSQGDDLGNK